MGQYPYGDKKKRECSIQLTSLIIQSPSPEIKNDWLYTEQNNNQADIIDSKMMLDFIQKCLIKNVEANCNENQNREVRPNYETLKKLPFYLSIQKSFREMSGRSSPDIFSKSTNLTTFYDNIFNNIAEQCNRVCDNKYVHKCGSLDNLTL